MKYPLTLIGCVLFLSAIASSSAVSPSYVTQNTTVSANTNGQTFTFAQFDTTLGTLTAVDLIINSSVPAGNFTLSRANSGSGTASFSSLTEFLLINDDYGDIFDGSGSPITIAVSGNSSIAKGSTELYTVNPSQSLLGLAPYTASISSGAWSYYQGSSLVTLNAGITAEAIYTLNKNITPSYTNLSATSSMTLRYSYTPPSPSPVPEAGQVAASLLLLAGVGSYLIIKRRKRFETISA